MKKLITLMLVCVLTVSVSLHENSAYAWTFNGQKAYNNASESVQREGKKVEDMAKKARYALEQLQNAANEMQKSNGKSNAKKSK